MEKITYKNKEYPLVVNHRSLRGVALHINRLKPDPKLVWDFLYYESMIFHAIKEGCREVEQPFDLTHDDAIDIHGEMKEEELLKIHTVFTQPSPKKREGKSTKTKTH